MDDQAKESTPQARRILVVDDEPDISETIKYCLEQEGYEVKTASNGYEALGVARVWQPRLVLLDVMLPGENGYRVSRLIKEHADRGVTSQTAVVLVTARKLDDPEREETFANFSRADGVIYKPFDLDHLLETVRRLVEVPVAA